MKSLHPPAARIALLARGTGLLVVLAVTVYATQWHVRSTAAAAAPLVDPLTQVVAPFPADLSSYAAVEWQQSLVLPDVPLGPARRVQLDLQRVEVFTPDAVLVAATPAGEVPLPRPSVAVFGGNVAGRDDSTAFLSFSPFGVYGWVGLGDKEFVVSSGPYGGGGPTVAYSTVELPAGTIQWQPWHCATDDTLTPPGYVPGNHDGGGPRSAACRLATIAIETDYEFTAWLFGGNTDAASAYVATLIGAVSGVYTRDANVRLQVGYLRLWTNSNDPWTQGDTVNQLYEFQNYWNANMTWVQRNAAHFLSGRGLGGGVAYLPGLCWPSYDYGLSANLAGYFPYPLQHNNGQNWDPFVVAHELGHNFGAPHTHDMTPPVDGCAWGDCSVGPNGTIMSYCHTCPGGMVNIRMEFHPRSVNEGILPYLDGNGWCDIRIAPVSITQHPVSQTVVAGQTAVFTVTATGASPLSYQWRRNGVNLTDGPTGHGSTISGALTATLTIDNTHPADAGNYDVIVTNPCGSVTSNAATLTVTPAVCRGDCNCDGAIDFADIDPFVTVLSGGTPCRFDNCDVNGDGTIDFADIDPFVGLLSAGATCP